MKFFVQGLIIAFSGAATPVWAGLEVGDQAPQVMAKGWLNLPPGMTRITEKDLQGQILLLEFWLSTGDACKKSVSFLNGMDEKFKDRGVVLIALSTEEKPIVSDFIKKQEVSYICGADARWSFTAYGIDKIPTFVLVDIEGKVAFVGTNPIQAMEKLTKLVEQSQPTGSFREKAAKNALKKAAKFVESGKYLKAADMYERIAQAFEGRPWAQEAEAKLKNMREDKDIAAKLSEQEARDKCEDLLEKARKAAENGDIPKAKKYYERIIEGYGQTKYAATARKELKALDE
jgi:peroxiredoxin